MTQTLYYDGTFAGIPRVKPLATLGDRVRVEVTHGCEAYPKGCQFYAGKHDLFTDMLRSGIDTIHLSGRPDLSGLPEDQPLPIHPGYKAFILG